MIAVPSVLARGVASAMDVPGLVAGRVGAVAVDVAGRVVVVADSHPPRTDAARERAARSASRVTPRMVRGGHPAGNRTLPYTPVRMSPSTAVSPPSSVPPQDEPTWPRWARVALPVGVVIAALAVLVWLGQDMTFYHDEYAFILQRDLSVDGLLKPHNEHLSVTLVALYRFLVGTVGTVSYWPYLAVTFVLHVIVAGIVFVVVRREATMAWAVGAMALVLLLGSGGDDILWAFQSGTIGAVAAGMGAIVVAPRRPAVAAVLLTVALATSGAGLAFAAGTGLHLLLTRPRALPWLLLPAALYGAWLLVYGASAIGEPHILGLADYVLTGLEASAAGAIGSTSLVIGQLVLLALVFGYGWLRSIPPVVLSLLASGVAFFTIAGLARAGLGPEQATAPRYVYIVAPSIIVAGVVLLARVRRPAGSVLGAVILAVAITGNLLLLVEAHDRFVSKLVCEQALTPLQRGSAGNPC